MGELAHGERLNYKITVDIIFDIKWAGRTVADTSSYCFREDMSKKISEAIKRGCTESVVLLSFNEHDNPGILIKGD